MITLMERLASNVTRSVEAEDPETSNFPRGVDVPMPTLPEESIIIYIVVEPMASVVEPVPAWMDKEAMGVDEPMPSFEVAVATVRKLAESKVVAAE